VRHAFAITPPRGGPWRRLEPPPRGAHRGDRCRGQAMRGHGGGQLFSLERTERRAASLAPYRRNRILEPVAFPARQGALPRPKEPNWLDCHPPSVQPKNLSESLLVVGGGIATPAKERQSSRPCTWGISNRSRALPARRKPHLQPFFSANPTGTSLTALGHDLTRGGSRCRGNSSIDAIWLMP
jgi:hypothetical protein